MGFRQLLKRLRPPTDPLDRAGIRPGVYPYLYQAEGTLTRFHLRVDPDGNGVLLANATAAASLRPSGVIIARSLLEGDNDSEIVTLLGASFRNVTAQAALDDIQSMRRVLQTLAAPGDTYPILNLPDPSFVPEATLLEKPLSADVPLDEPPRLLPILGRLWQLGIPHVTFLAGANPPTADLVRAVERAEDLGMIAGVRGRASDLASGSLLLDLVRAGIDHVDLLYLSSQPEIHDALAGAGDHARAVEAFRLVCQHDVCPVANVALVQATLTTIEETLVDLAERGVRNVAFYAIGTTDAESCGAVNADALAQVAARVEQATAEADVRFLWYPTLQFNPALPLAEQVRHGPRCSGDNAIRVQPDGSVVPPRGPFRSAGNILTDDWEAIRRQETYRSYRQRLESDTHCDDCPGLAICAADCPRNPAGWAEAGG
jgi:radical SAM protein with 4Fe4S-binding SPASM domain